MDFTHRKINGKYYVRVTYMLSSVNAKGKGFEYFLKKYGDQADEIAKKAADSGTRVHAACEFVIKNLMANPKWKIAVKPADYSLDRGECAKLKGFLSWVKDYKPVFKESEIDVNDGQCSGRLDILCELDGQLYVVDIKTGSNIWDEHYFQCCFYSKAYTLEQPGFVKPSILHLKDTTKKGYQFIEIDYQKYIKGYEISYELYVLRGLPLVPSEEEAIPEILTLED